MEKVDIIKVYNLLDANGNKLQLRFGQIVAWELHFNGGRDKGFRWSFIGHNIPMPVRNRTWFNGFPESIMLDWLNRNGWYIQTCVDMSSGKADVYELPNGDDDLCIEITPERDREDEEAFCKTIRELVHNGKLTSAIRIYRYANGGTIYDAHQAVTEIYNET